MHLYFDFFTYNSSALVESAFGAFWEDPEGGFIKFVVKRASKQDQTLHMEGKLHIILYFRVMWYIVMPRIYLILKYPRICRKGGGPLLYNIFQLLAQCAQGQVSR